MTKEEVEQIQLACREWLQRPDTSQQSRLTIPAAGALSRPLELKINALLTFDNVLIMSADDAETGACYAKLIRQPDGTEEIFDTPFERIAPNPVAVSEPAQIRATQQRYQDAMEQFAETRQRDATPLASADDTWWVEKIGSSEPRPKYLLFTNRTLLGYSLLERECGGQRSGRFHPSEDYFEYGEIFAALPDAENDCLEADAREAYGILGQGSSKSRTRFAELSTQVDELKLYVESEDGNRLNAVEVKLEDLSQKYDDQTERWLYVTIVHK